MTSQSGSGKIRSAESHPGSIDSPSERAVVSGFRVTVATAGNGSSGRYTDNRNGGAIGLAGWTLQAQDANPLSAEVPAGESRDAVVAVTDGLPGLTGSEEAARIAAHCLTRRRVTATGADPAGSGGGPARLQQAFIDADAAIHAAKLEPASEMGCAAAALLTDVHGQAVVGNVGDVRVYRIVDGYLGQVSSGKLASADGVGHCLGGLYREEVQPLLYEILLRPDDRLLMCNAGLHRQLSEQELLRHSAARRPEDVARNLVRASLQNGAADNVVVAVLDVLGSTVRTQNVAEAPAVRRAVPPAQAPQGKPPAIPPSGAATNRRGRKWWLGLR